MTAMAAILSLQQWSLEGTMSRSVSVTFNVTSFHNGRLEPPRLSWPKN